MAILGAHQSIAGGFHKAAESAHARGCDCLQIFTKNTNQWRAREITADECRQFQEALSRHGIACPLAHDSYLINIASSQRPLWRRSVQSLSMELLRAETLGIPWVVAHPGAYTNGSESRGLRRIVRALDEVLAETSGKRVGCLLETTAGQGTSLGWRFEHLAEILANLKNPDRMAVRFDTCHVCAAGYPLATRAQYQSTMKQFDEVVGLGQIRAFHLNDSLRPCGSRVDRHAHIGEGYVGLGAFKRLLGDSRFREVPMVLETPKEPGGPVDWDKVNLQRLRKLVRE